MDFVVIWSNFREKVFFDFNVKKTCCKHKLSLRVFMFEVSFNVDLKERVYIDFLYDGLKEKIKMG